MTKNQMVDQSVEFDKDSLLTPDQKRIVAEYRKQTPGFSKNQKPPEKEPEERKEKLSWVARKVPGIQKKFREMVGVMLYDPRRHKNRKQT